MPLALNDLAAEMRNIRVRYWLVHMHLCLNLVRIRPLVQPSHLDVLDLGLCDPRAFSRKELLLVLLVYYTMLHFVRLWGGALGLRELLVYYVRFDLRGILHVRVLVDCHLVW